jgi:predicted dehydrogenase
MIKISVVGLGQMGVNHLNNLLNIKNISLINIYDKIKRKELANKYNTKFSENIKEVINNSDATIIATPTTTHFKYFLECSKKIKNIFIEKPLVTDIKQFKKILQITKKKKINLKVGYIERYNPTIQLIKKILKKNKILNLDFIRTNNRQNKIKDTNIIFDIMTHDIDLALYLSGDVKRISSSGVKKRNKIKFAISTLEHKNKCITRILSNSECAKRIRTLNITTEKNYISANLLTREIIITKKNFGKKSNNLEKKIYAPNKNALLEELKDFIKSCKKNPNNKLLDTFYKNTLICKEIQKQIFSN